MKKHDPSTLYGVIGLGRFGAALVKTLSEAGKEVIAIDKNEERVREVARMLSGDDAETSLDHAREMLEG